MSNLPVLREDFTPAGDLVSEGVRYLSKIAVSWRKSEKEHTLAVGEFFYAIALDSETPASRAAYRTLVDRATEIFEVNRDTIGRWRTDYQTANHLPPPNAKSAAKQLAAIQQAVTAPERDTEQITVRPEYVQDPDEDTATPSPDAGSVPPLPLDAEPASSQQAQPSPEHTPVPHGAGADRPPTVGGPAEPSHLPPTAGASGATGGQVLGNDRHGAAGEPPTADDPAHETPVAAKAPGSGGGAAAPTRSGPPGFYGASPQDIEATGAYHLSSFPSATVVVDNFRHAQRLNKWCRTRVVAGEVAKLETADLVAAEREAQGYATALRAEIDRRTKASFERITPPAPERQKAFAGPFPKKAKAK